MILVVMRLTSSPIVFSRRVNPFLEFCAKTVAVFLIAWSIKLGCKINPLQKLSQI